MLFKLIPQKIETIADRSSDNTYRSQRITDTASDIESNLEHKSGAL